MLCLLALPLSTVGQVRKSVLSSVEVDGKFTYRTADGEKSIDPSASMQLSMAELRNKSAVSASQLPKSLYINDDGQDGMFYYDPADNTSVDDGALCIVASGRRYKRKVEVIRPEYFGAKGDRVTDDTGPMRKASAAAVSTGRVLAISARQRYRITDELTMPGSIRILMEPGSELFFDNSGAKRMIKTRYSLELTGSGTLSGNWSMAGQNTANVTASKVLGQRLLGFSDILINNAICKINGITFTRCGDLALYISPDRVRPHGEISVTNCKFLDNYSAVHYDNLGGTKPIVGAVFQDNIIKRCAMGAPGSSFSDAYYFGNGFVSWGPFKKLLFDRNTIDSCGRMGVELFINGEQVLTNVNPTPNEELQITRNVISNCGYFCLSQQGNNNVITNNYLKNWHADYIEMLGNGTVVEKNFMDGVGFSTTSNDRGIYTSFDRGNLTCRDNIFVVRGFQKEIIQVTYAENPLVERNTVYCYERRTGTIGFRSPIQVNYCLNATVRGNKVIAAAPFNSPLYSFGRNVGLDWSKDDLTLKGYANDSLDVLLSVNLLRNSTIRGIRVHADAPMRFKYSLIDGLHYGIGSIHAYSWDGTAFTHTQLTSTTIGPTPPTSPAVNDSYWIGENPTGAWAGQARKLAKWTGTAWTFTTVSDVFPYEASATKEPFSSGIGLPIKGNTVGTTYILIDGPGLYNVRFDDNDFTASGKLTNSNNALGFSLFNTQLWNVGNVNSTEPVITNSLRLADLTVQKNVVTPSAATTDLSLYETSDHASQTYTTQTQNDVRYVRPGVPTSKFSFSATDAAGNGAMYQNGTVIFHTYGSENQFLGANSGNLTLTGIRNLGSGGSALNKLTTGSRNIGIGVAAGNNLKTGNSNLFMGYLAGSSIDSGNDNIGFGYQAMSGGASTSANVGGLGIGTSAGLNSVGNQNVFLGYDTGGGLIGSNNIAVGPNAGKMDNAATIVAIGNLFLGLQSGKLINANSNITNNIYLGAGSGEGTGSASNTIFAGKPSQPMTFSLAGSATITGSTTSNAFVGSGSTPTVTVGPAAGTGATVSVSGNAFSGRITITTGTGTQTGVLVTVSLPAVGTSVLNPLVSNANNTVVGGLGTANETTTGYTINAAVAPGTGTYYITYLNGR